MQSKRNFLIYSAHRRWKRLWQLFFTGWGLVLVAALVAGSLFSQQLLWTPISAINMKEIANNQFKMTNAAFAGTDKNGQPFTLNAQIARQEYDNPNIMFVEKIFGTVSHVADGKIIHDKFSANRGEYDLRKKAITLFGNVHINSDNGDKITTNELTVEL